ncbi:uncharacterized protein LOC125265320 [Megalobrama amblycephala]|uniref:uncharacterized protein LOC125265320 n=1 Tax=Megalobrama amblycephala TaxID=75352 RepID=UPI00201475F6|nr:uncharacterized protein LOC125265320 [Megalobrama amblycephala]
MRYYFILLLFSTISCSSDVDVVQEDVKIVRAGEDVNLTCNFLQFLQSTIWFKQTAEGKSLQIVYLYLEQPSWNKDFEKTNRFNVSKGDDHFNLTILKTKPSDSATYYCVVTSYYSMGMGAGTRLLVRDAAVAQITLQQSLIDTLHPGDSVNLQCSIFTESCAGEHSVYWFRQSSGDSQGVLYTKGERNGQCNKSSESQTQSCVYNLLKSNISHSDTGIYYCAVAACGEILFGKGTQLNFKVSGDLNLTLALGILNIIFLALVVFLGIKLCRTQNKVSTPQESQNEDTMNYAAISFAQKPLNSRRTKSKIIQDQSLYAQVRSQQ